MTERTESYMSGARVASMASKKLTKTTNNEAQLRLMDRIALVLTVVNTDESSSEEDYEETFESMLDVAALIGVALKINVTQVEDDLITMTAQLDETETILDEIFSSKDGE